jgi:hypothetical protein
LIATFEGVCDLLPVGMAIAYGPQCSRIRANATLRATLGVRATAANISKSATTGPTLPFRVCRDGKEVRPEDLPMQVAAREGVAVQNARCEIHRKDGEIIVLKSFVQPWLSAEGTHLGSVGVFFNEAPAELELLGATLSRPESSGPLLRICASCRKIAEGDSWSSLEQFLEHSYNARFSHGLCPDCFEHAMSTVLPPAGN